MKSLYKYSLIIASFFAVFACNNDENDTATQEDINDFVWKGLNSWYYWQPDVPQLADNAFSSNSAYKSFISGKSPDNLFYSLLNNYPTTDRFSWIVSDVDALLQSFSGVSKSSGMDVSFYYKDSGNNNIVGLINYIVPNSPASQAGLKRGDVISDVNGASLTVANYQSVMKDNANITIAANVSSSSSGIVTSGVLKNATLTSVVLEENPIAHYQTYTHNAQKVGYLVYNGFKSNYNDELNAAFAQMKTDQITDLVLDLRYNGGGSLESAVALGQMITGQFTGSPYVRVDFNNKHNQHDETSNFSNKVKIYSYVNGTSQSTGEQNINSLQLSKVYVLTSNGTASASELLIDALKPYINVVTIGTETYGKFVGSITLFDSPLNDYTSYSNRSKGHNWAMQAITFAYFNKNNDTHPTGGIVANFGINNYDNFGTIKDFGVTTDPALSKALYEITGHIFRMSSPRSNFDRQKSFLGSKKTLTKLGTELYIQDFERFNH